MSRLTLKQANTIIEKALEKAREMKIKPLSVVVLDEAGNVRSAQREDGASMFRFDVALGKDDFKDGSEKMQGLAAEKIHGADGLQEYHRRNRHPALDHGDGNPLM